MSIAEPRRRRRGALGNGKRYTVVNSNAAGAHLAGPPPPGGARRARAARRHDARGRAGRSPRRRARQGATLWPSPQRRQDHRRFGGNVDIEVRPHATPVCTNATWALDVASGAVMRAAERRAAAAALLHRRRAGGGVLGDAGGRSSSSSASSPARLPRQPDLAPGAARRRARALAVVGGAGGRRDALKTADGALPPRHARRHFRVRSLERPSSSCSCWAATTRISGRSGTFGHFTRARTVPARTCVGRRRKAAAERASD